MSEDSSRNRSLFADSLPDFPVGGIVPFTTVDFPGRLAAVLFAQGCPWRCAYCFNQELQPFTPRAGLSDRGKLLNFLTARRGMLDGIVFSGGEASAHESLIEWMCHVRSLGYAVGLHTAGIYPEHLKKILPYCDWVGMDAKAPFVEYEKITGIRSSGDKARESASLILESKVEYEFRTTLHPELLSDDDVLGVAFDLHALGARNYAVQIFKSSPGIALSSCGSWCFPVYLEKRLRNLFPHFVIRS